MQNSIALYFKEFPRKLLSQMMTLKNTWTSSSETRIMKRLWSLCLRLRRQCEIQGQSRGIMGIPAIAVAAMAISKRPVNLRHHEWSPSFRQPNSSPYKSGQSEWQGSAIVGWLLRK